MEKRLVREMKLISNILSKKLPFLILLVAIGTYFSPFYWKVATWVPSFLLGVVIFFTGLSMNIASLKKMRTKKRELLAATILKWTISVIISIGLAYIFFASKPEIAAGLILSGTLPSATSATVYTFLAGGNTSLVIAASLLDVVISPIVAPLSMMGMFNEHINISFFSLLQSFLLIVVLPLGIGLFTQKTWPGSEVYSKSATKFGSSIALLLIVHTIVGGGKDTISSEISSLPLIAVATFLQVILPMVAAYFIARKIHISEGDSRAILFHVGLCNTSLAAILAFKFIGELGAIAPILNMIFNLSIGAHIANYFNKLEGADSSAM